MPHVSARMIPTADSILYIDVTAGDIVTMFITGVPSFGIPPTEILS